MKLKILALVAGAGLLALQSTQAAAGTDIYVGLDFGIPAPVYVERAPAYYYEHEPVYYYYEDPYPRRYVYREREVHYVHERHDHGRHRGHRHRHRHHHH